MLTLALLTPALAQEPGWHYSPLPGEGDRAVLGCALGSTPTAFACVAVRCEDDFSTGVHLYSSRAGDAGHWAITIDKETRSFAAEAAAPYGAQLVGDIAWVLDGLANGAVAYLEPEDGSAMPANHIALDGSLYAINRALAFCAPRVGSRGALGAYHSKSGPLSRAPIRNTSLISRSGAASTSD